MGKMSLQTRIRQFFAGICFRLFLRFEGITSQEYFDQIDDERLRGMEATNA